MLSAVSAASVVALEIVWSIQSTYYACGALTPQSTYRIVVHDAQVHDVQSSLWEEVSRRDWLWARIHRCQGHRQCSPHLYLIEEDELHSQ